MAKRPYSPPLVSFPLPFSVFFPFLSPNSPSLRSSSPQVSLSLYFIFLLHGRSAPATPLARRVGPHHLVLANHCCGSTVEENRTQETNTIFGFFPLIWHRQSPIPFTFYEWELLGHRTQPPLATQLPLLSCHVEREKNCRK